MFFTNEVIEFSLEQVNFILSDFKHQTIEKPYPLHYHNKDCLEIHYIKSGSGIAIIDDSTFQIEKGYFYITGPFVIHGQIPNPGNALEKYSMYFTIDTSECKEQIFEMIKRKVCISKTKFDVEPLFDTIETEFKTKPFGYRHMVAEAIKMIILLLDRNYNHSKATNEEQFTNTLYEIERIFINEYKTITLPELAKRLFMSEREFQRFLAKNYNKSFNTLKLEARMFFAANQLLYTDSSIQEISEAAGYSSCEHFSYAFRKYYNTTPLKFRKNNEIDLNKPIFLNLRRS